LIIKNTYSYDKIGLEESVVGIILVTLIVFVQRKRVTVGLELLFTFAQSFDHAREMLDGLL
jgi:hypothetical protein